MDFGDSYVDVMFRFGHILSGIIWVGILYFFNLVNGPFTAQLDAETKKKVVPELMYRCLFFFRWAAMSTLLFGLLLFWWNYMHLPGMRTPDEQVTGRALYIMIGMTVALTMWFNVWFIIWPAQKKILPAVRRGEAPPAGLPQRAMLASRYNTYASGPMLLLMGMGSVHYGSFHWGMVALDAVIGLAVVHALLTIGKNLKVPA